MITKQTKKADFKPLYFLVVVAMFFGFFFFADFALAWFDSDKYDCYPGGLEAWYSQNEVLCVSEQEATYTVTISAMAENCMNELTGYLNMNDQGFELEDAGKVRDKTWGPFSVSETGEGTLEFVSDWYLSHPGGWTTNQYGEDIKVPGCYIEGNDSQSINCCVDTSWSPDPSTVCEGEPFVQTSNCGNERDAVGTKDCGSAPTATLQEPFGDYCSVPPELIFSWSYEGTSAQSAFRFQVATDASFANVVRDTEKTQSSQNFYYLFLGSDLDYGTTYFWRLMVWDSSDVASGWIEGSESLETFLHQGPSVDFSWNPETLETQNEIQFIDQSTVYGGTSKKSWAWTFASGIPSTSSEQNPNMFFEESGQHQVSLSVWDSDDYFCAETKLLEVETGVPRWKEVAPFSFIPAYRRAMASLADALFGALI